MTGPDDRAAELMEHARAAVATWPPFTPAQLADLAKIITIESADRLSDDAPPERSET